MKAGKMKKVLLLILCVIISITIIYTAIFHTLPFVIIGKKLYFTQARKVYAIEGSTIYDDKDMYRLSKFSNVRQLEICGKDLDPVFLENKDKLEYLYINDLALKAADLSDEKPFAKLKELDMTSDGFDMDISIFMILTLGIDLVCTIKKELVKLMGLMLIILIVCEIVTIGFAGLITAPVMIIWSLVEIWKSTDKMRERTVLLLLNPILHISVLVIGFAAELWFSDYKFGQLY